jgi:hypothetical protein
VVNGDGLYSINSIADGTPPQSVTIDFRTAAWRAHGRLGLRRSQVQSTAVVLGGVMAVSQYLRGHDLRPADNVATRMTINMKDQTPARRPSCSTSGIRRQGDLQGDARAVRRP